jgi:hypothetical protein
VFDFINYSLLNRGVMNLFVFLPHTGKPPTRAAPPAVIPPLLTLNTLFTEKGA